MKYTVLFLLLFYSCAVYGQDQTEFRQTVPPQVSIIHPLNGSVFDGLQIKVDYVVSGTVPKSVKILVDDKAVQLLTVVKLGQNTVIVDVPDHNCKISIVAQSDFGASVPAVVNLTRSEHILKPTFYVLAIGISNYSNSDIRLQFPAKDADDFSQSMLRQEELLYKKVELRLLTDHTANADNIRDGLYWLQSETTSRDVAMLYMAGHGVNNNIGDFFFMPVNADIDRINASCVGYAEIKSAISAIAGKVIVFMDACHSGNVLGNNQRRSAVINQAVNDLAGTDNGSIVFTSSTGRQFSLENPEWNNGAFTKALVEGLNGKADMFNRKVVTVKFLDLYITDRVKELTKGQQAPTTIIPTSIPDFPIAVVPNHESTTASPKTLGPGSPPENMPTTPKEKYSGAEIGDSLNRKTVEVGAHETPPHFDTSDNAIPVNQAEITSDKYNFEPALGNTSDSAKNVTEIQTDPGYETLKAQERKEKTTQSGKNFTRYYIGLEGGVPEVIMGLNAAYFLGRQIGVGFTVHLQGYLEDKSRATFYGPVFYGHWGRRNGKFFFPTNVGLGGISDNWCNHDNYNSTHNHKNTSVGCFVSVGVAYRPTSLISIGLNTLLALGPNSGMLGFTLGVNFHF